MEEVGAQVAAPVFIHQQLSSSRFCEPNIISKKRTLPFQQSHQAPANNWSSKSWDWDSARFVAKPAGNASQSDHEGDGEHSESLQLKLGDKDGGLNSAEETRPVSRPNKKVRSGSPGGPNYPMCQVDNCKEDLSTAKDYHRRHKVCEVHSKATKALVGKQMQRFCQQCSRFHPLSEFDEGKRSCRRRLAGHNRRRRKTQLEDNNAASRLLVPGNRENNGTCEMDIVNLLADLARAQQGNNNDRNNNKFSALPDKDQLIQILSKINSLPLPPNVASKLPTLANPKTNLASSENQTQPKGNNPSTLDLLAALATTPSPDRHETQCQPSSEGSDSDRSNKSAGGANNQVTQYEAAPKVGGERSSMSYHSPCEDSDSHAAQSTYPNLPLPLFSSSPEDENLRRKYFFSSESSNPSAERSPSSSPPVVYNLFPMQTSRETVKSDCVSTVKDKDTLSNGCSTSLQLFGNSIRPAENGSIQSSPGYTSSSGSDHSPSSLNSDAQDRTGRIIFKLFDKDPSQLPGSLRTQIYNWLQNSPSEMESYIRPGCIVLSVYMSMPSHKWNQVEENLVNYVKSLVRDAEADFWRHGRFLVSTDKQMVSHKDGKVRLSKFWRAWSTPELISVSPVALVHGQETSLLLKGRNLNVPGTNVYCTNTAEYDIEGISSSSCEETGFDNISVTSFKIHGSKSSVLGRCFIEVENGFKGTSFPIIIADKTTCHELRLLESGISCEVHDGINVPNSREEILHFLNELGWLFQRKHNASFFENPDYQISRFKFLLTFSVEHDFYALVKTLLDILLEINLMNEGVARESLDMLSEVQLLNRAVKRRCTRMVDLLVRYCVTDHADNSKKYIFLPNMAGPAGLTPLHLAACASSAEDLVDSLTNDPQEIGMHSWNSVLDENGMSPYAYASMRNNDSYNAFVAQKLADKKNGQISLSIGNEIEPATNQYQKDTFNINKSCSRCAVSASRHKSTKFRGPQGLLQRPYINSMLAIAAVCVCVCLFFRGAPDIGSVAPFKWENLGYGAF